MRKLFVLSLILGIASFANAAPIWTSTSGPFTVDVWDATDPGSPGYDATQGAVPAGYASIDIAVTIAGDVDWTQSQMLSHLTSGSFYQDTTYGGNVHPNPSFYGLVPGLAFDTYVVATSYPGSGADNATQIAGGALNLGGSASVTMDSSLLDVTWFDTETSYPNGQIARVTYSADAAGSLDLLVYNAAQDQATFSIPLPVPEPVSLLLMVSGLVGLIRRR